MKFNTEIKVEDQIIKDMIITALEGGSNYWYFLPDLSMLPEREEGDESTISERIGKGVLDEGIILPVYDVEEQDMLGHISKESIEKGLRLMYQDYDEHFNDMVEEDYDGCTADVFLQLVVMGEITFG